MIPRHHIAFLLGLLLTGFVTLQHCLADPTLPGLITDHMVLQRNQPIRLRGTADALEIISVTLAGNSATTKTAMDGKWSATLPAMKAGGPFTLVVQGKTTIAIHDVMIGEVWVASGQSNMNFSLSGSTGAEAELLRADRPYIRLFKVPLHSALEPQHSTDASWALCNPGTAASFSAVAYYFARDLNLALNVPIGIIQSSWSGSTGEEWTDAQSLQSKPQLKTIVDHWRQTPPEVKDFAENGESFDLQFDDFQLLSSGRGMEKSKKLSMFEDGEARTEGGGYWQTELPGALELVEHGQGASPYAAHFSGRMSLEAVPAVHASLHADNSPEDLSGYSALHFYARGKGCFHTHLAIPTIVDGDDYSSQTVCATKQWQKFTVQFQDLRQAGWGVTHPLTLDQVSGFAINMDAGLHGEGQRPPSGLYNGMIVPITEYAIRGAIWYQGEGNANRAGQYRVLLPEMIGSWRRAWGEGNFPFLIVQLPNLGQPQLNAEDSNWAELREAQLLTAKSVPATELVVTIDLGEAGNLHPPRKAEVGQRLALSALGGVYGRPIEYSGPLLASTEAKSSSIRLRFSHATGLSAHGGGSLQGFAIAGVDRKFVPATAVIQGSTVIVSSPQVPVPVAVRYAWAGNPICNLVNGADLPASPFRADAWPVPYGGKEAP